MILYRMGFLLSLLLGSMSWGPAWAEDGDSRGGVVAQMNGLTLTMEQFRAILADLDPDSRRVVEANPEVLRKLARDEVVKRQVRLLAEKAGTGQRPEVAERMTRAADQVLVSAFIQDKTLPDKGFPDEKLLRETYDKNRQNLRAPARFHVAQIYLEYPRDGADKARAEVLQEAHTLYRELTAGKKDFEKSARSRSRHKESADKGGDMGWLEADRILPDLVPILARMLPGEVTNPVPAAQGVHIFRLLEFAPGEIRKFEEVAPLLVQSLRREAIARKEQQFLSEILRATPPVLNEDLLKKSLSP